MTTTPVPTEPDASADMPTKPNASADEPRAERRASDAPGQEPSAATSDRAVDADLLLDIPQLTVEELTLELDASLLLNQIKLDAKGLQAGLYAKANFGPLQALVQHRSGSTEPTGSEASDPRGGVDALRLRSGLRELLGATREAYRDLSDRDVQQQLREVHESADEAHAHLTDTGNAAPAGPNGHERDRDGGRQDAAGGRARHAAAQGVKAAGLTAAGLAGGVLMESRVKPFRKLPGPWHRSRARAIRDEIGKRLPI